MIGGTLIRAEGCVVNSLKLTQDVCDFRMRIKNQIRLFCKIDRSAPRCIPRVLMYTMMRHVDFSRGSLADTRINQNIESLAYREVGIAPAEMRAY